MKVHSAGVASVFGIAVREEVTGKMDLSLEGTTTQCAIEWWYWVCQLDRHFVLQHKRLHQPQRPDGAAVKLQVMEFRDC